MGFCGEGEHCSLLEINVRAVRPELFMSDLIKGDKTMMKGNFREETELATKMV